MGGCRNCSRHRNTWTSPIGTPPSRAQEGGDKLTNLGMNCGDSQTEDGGRLPNLEDMAIPRGRVDTRGEHLPEASSGNPVFNEASTDPRSSCGCGLICALGPCATECRRMTPHPNTECSCERHIMDMDAERFAGHLRKYLNSAGVDTTGRNNHEIRTRSLIILKKLADEAGLARAETPVDQYSQ